MGLNVGLKQNGHHGDARKALIRLVGLPRLERGTYCLGGSRSIHLSYRPIENREKSTATSDWPEAKSLGDVSGH